MATASPQQHDNAGESTSCPICGSSTRLHLRGLYDDRYGYPDAFDLYRCADCGHGVLDPLLDGPQLEKLYTAYYPRGGDPVDPRAMAANPATVAAWKSGPPTAPFLWVSGGARVLDVGCGVGISLAYLESIGCEAVGCEADANVAAIAKKYGLNIRIGLFDPADYEPHSFDYVTMAQVLEHTLDPVATLRSLQQVLKPSGKVVLSMPNAGGWLVKLLGRRWINWHVPYHLQHFTRKSLNEAAVRAGFVVEKTVVATPRPWVRLQVGHLLEFPRRGVPSPVWSPSGSRGGLASRVRQRALAELNRSRLFCVVAAVLDKFGAGDCLVVQLSIGKQAHVDRPAGT
ncbi:MAG: class I SAM-dependent methyltransferase [Nitrospirota bacterium]|nr:class I SAM-dependent methyltransferase [Nitrospirota bacterium]